MVPALAANTPPRQAAEAIANARTAALLDPEGEALSKCLSDIEAAGTRRVAAE
jgi:indolepyruvate ferredoxin oxidoreductase beta subunit